MKSNDYIRISYNKLFEKLISVLNNEKIVAKIYFVEQVLIWMLISSATTFYILKTNF